VWIEILPSMCMCSQSVLWHETKTARLEPGTALTAVYCTLLQQLLQVLCNSRGSPEVSLDSGHRKPQPAQKDARLYNLDVSFHPDAQTQCACLIQHAEQGLNTG
jgi:hypothetical protein